MLHYVRGDGGQIMVPKEELVRWLEDNAYAVDADGLHVCLPDLMKELEAMGK